MVLVLTPRRRQRASSDTRHLHLPLSAVCKALGRKNSFVRAGELLFFLLLCNAFPFPFPSCYLSRQPQLRMGIVRYISLDLTCRFFTVLLLVRMNENRAMRSSSALFMRLCAHVLFPLPLQSHPGFVSTRPREWAAEISALGHLHYVSWKPLTFPSLSLSDGGGSATMPSACSVSALQLATLLGDGGV
ncbi:hypothetical protein K431DRAFT_84621 [Polychaeton citri CBS 116435]|uniref:Uncharacterized protein n=1 Tax=Polychaeton citri CBS 116435 TaxID=1314669 RepID=A0A9P4Q5B0_9PEZI|nr:hypothetical protein K431DRAFT_84621 [Polychaeton citri CBS 116435]